MKELYLNSLYRLRKKTFLYVAFAIIIALGLIVNLSMYYQHEYLANLYSDPTYEYYFSINENYLALYSPTSFPMILVPVFSIYFISEDYRNDTFRNQILAGKTRKQIFFNSLFVCLSIYLSAVILSLIFGLCVSLLVPGWKLTCSGSEFFFDLWVCFFIGIMINTFACFCVSSLSGTAAAIVVFLAVLIGCNSIPFLSGFNYLIINKAVLNTFIYDEFLFPYQVSHAISSVLDEAYLYAYDNSLLAVYDSIQRGRTLSILLKNFFMTSGEIALFTIFGMINFERKNLR